MTAPQAAAEDSLNSSEGQLTQATSSQQTSHSCPSKHSEDDPQVLEPVTKPVTTRDPICPSWTRCTQGLHQGISWFVTTVALHAVKHPKTYIVVISLLSLTLIAAGFFTNFELVLDLQDVLTPVNSKPQQHAEWITSDEGFPNQIRLLQMVFHLEGQNVLQIPQARRVLEAVETIQETPGYDDLCSQGVYRNFDNELACRIFSVSGYWQDHSLAEFDATVTSDADLLKMISGNELADGSPVIHDAIVGNYNKTINGTLTSAESYLIRLELPDVGADSDAFEKDMLKRLDSLRRRWMKEDKQTDTVLLHMDFVTIFAYQLEFMRTIIGDLYLVVFSALLMVGFTCIVFYRRDPYKSRSQLGVFSVLTIGCSIMAGNGLMFLIGIPYSTVHQMLPFIIFGIGLDDTFIITGAYFRTNPDDSIEDRIRDTMQEVGWSISVTTLTTAFAFTLGYVSSSFPGVHWLCLSAVTTIMIDFYFQITYFVAFLVLDERRIQANRKDCCFWIALPAPEEEEYEKEIDVDDFIESSAFTTNETKKCQLPFDSDSEESEELKPSTSKTTKQDLFTSTNTAPTLVSEMFKASSAHMKTEKKSREQIVDRRPLPERVMSIYADLLLQPIMKGAVLVGFALFFALCCWNASCLTQEFDVGSYVTEDSYLRNIFTSLNEYSSVVRPVAVYFRNVDQSDPQVQQQMIDYITELEALEQVWSVDNMTSAIAEYNSGGFTSIEKVRPFCWVRDFQELDQFFANQPPALLEVFNNLTFTEKLDFVLQDKTIREVYSQDLVRDEDGDIVTSRCYLFLQDIDLKDVKAQIDMLFDQREVTLAQPMNQMEEHQKDWAFFAYDELFGYWEAYSVSVEELIFTMIAGIVAVTFISFVFIPHWTASFLVFPLIVILYVNMLGSLQCLGLHINGLTYVCMVVSIGLLVDFLIHVLLRYYECAPGMTRDERVKETLETMGASILIGGATTFLAVVPIAFSSAKIFMTVFNSFFAMVALGCTHGLILLPVVLSLVGPTINVRGVHKAEEERDFPAIPASNTGSTLSSECVQEVDVDDFPAYAQMVVHEACQGHVNPATSREIDPPPDTTSEISC